MCYAATNGKDRVIVYWQGINSLLKKRVNVKDQHKTWEFISPIFVWNKSGGGFKLILKLKNLNEHVEYQKLKMETLSSTLCLMRPNDYMAKINIEDAYHGIKILKQHQKILKFIHKSCLYKFAALPNGYTEGLRKFTKALKPPLIQCKKNKIVVAGYFDDLITMGSDQNICINNMKEISRNFFSLDFIVHPEKTLFSPTETLEFLGFVINSSTMTVCFMESKKQVQRNWLRFFKNFRKQSTL